MLNTAQSTTRASVSYESLLRTLHGCSQSSQLSTALLIVNIENPVSLQGRLGMRDSATFSDELAERFTNALGQRAMVIRSGDFSYYIAVNGVRNNGHALLAAEKLVRVADSVMADRLMNIKADITVGLALYPTNGNEIEEVLNKAQLASAAAGKRGKQVVAYSEDCKNEIVIPTQLGEAFAAALDSGDLTVCYQPKICIESGRIAGSEALLRWLRDGKPVTTPDVFIPIAEEAGLMQNATWYVLSNSMRMSAANNNLPVAVNITPGMLHHRDFLEMVETAVQSWNIKPDVLTIELTEGALVEDFEQAVARLTHIRKLGVRVSIDDFGTGYSSLSYFKKIPADEIKIDKSFVIHMMQNDADQRLVQTIVSLARQFGLKTVAEGVEDRATLELLATLGCDYAQGFVFAPALDQHHLRQWLDAFLPIPANN